MKRVRCSQCGGSGKVANTLGILLDPRSWVPFHWSSQPIWKRCEGCDGKGYAWQEWQPYSPRYRRRGG